MRRFIKFSLIFIIPLAVFFVTLEAMVLRIPNDYSYKYDYVKEHGSSIKVIAIGHSQLLNGFIPEVYGDSTFNLSNAGQRYIDDYYILHELIDSLHNLRQVIIPIGYLDVVDALSDTTLQELSVYYHEYMHLDYDGKLPLGHYFECFNIRQTCGKLIKHYILGEAVLSCEKHGERYKPKNKNIYSTTNVLYTYTVKKDVDMKIQDGYYLERLLELLIGKKIKVLLVSPPYLWSLFRDKNEDQISFHNSYVNNLLKRYDVTYIDLQDSDYFSKEDYADVAHLSFKGAHKFTSLLRQYNN